MNNSEFENLVKENQKLKYELSSLSKCSKKTQQELEDEINKLREINVFSHEKIQELEKIISLIENSRSWKMTKNARSIGDKLRKIKNIYQMIPVAIKRKGGVISFSKLFYSKIKQGGIKNLRYSIQTFINHNQAQHTTSHLIPKDSNNSFFWVTRYLVHCGILISATMTTVVLKISFGFLLTLDKKSIFSL